MMESLSLLALGLLAGFTIFLGVPIIKLAGTSNTRRGFLSSLASGILLFLLIEVVSDAASNVMEAHGIYMLVYSLALVFGFVLGSFGLVQYESSFLKRRSHESLNTPLLTAIGIGLHNFGEGLAIGASYAAGAFGLATFLVIGFGSHNATEGFAIFGPLKKEEVNAVKVVTLGLIGGAPTLVGTLIGGSFYSSLLSTVLLSLAGGSILYVVLSVYSHTSHSLDNRLLFGGLLCGFVIAFATDMAIVAASGGAL
jgi:zinc transporter ZupT